MYNPQMVENNYPGIQIISTPITVESLKQIAADQFGDLVKAVTDIRLGVLALGGELHADEETLLLERGSEQRDLWGINIYPDRARSEWVEFDSLINIRPSQNNRSRYVEDAATRQKIIALVDSLIE